MPGVVNGVAGGRRPRPSRKLWHIAGSKSGGVDCGGRRRNLYDKKPRRYAKDNRTSHLTARSDKSVAYVTNNKRLYSTFCSTGRHEASRGLFVTAELLVFIRVWLNRFCRVRVPVRTPMFAKSAPANLHVSVSVYEHAYCQHLTRNLAIANKSRPASYNSHSGQQHCSRSHICCPTIIMDARSA